MIFGRREPLHEKLARIGGLGPGPGAPRDLLSRISGAGIHGLHRLREWDAVVTADAPGLHGDRVVFAALSDGSLLVEEQTGDDDLTPLADAVEGALERPYRAEAVRSEEELWAVAARRIQVVELGEDPGGDELTLSVGAGERELLVDGARTFGSIPELERLGGDHDAFVVTAERLDGTLWEVRVSPL